MALDLALVMPVYNEQECIREVVSSWLATLSKLGADFAMIILNDGSRDGTADALAAFAADGRVEIVNKENSGHGPTILMGYRRAVKLADWVFQCDSDNEMQPEHFPRLWEKRGQYEALFGARVGRRQAPARRLISMCARLAVRLFFGKGIADVNTPYRLIRSDILRPIIAQIPPDTLAPNVIISGALAKSRARIYQHPVPHEPRKTGQVSIKKWKLWRSAWRAFWQTARCRPVITAVGCRRDRGP